MNTTTAAPSERKTLSVTSPATGEKIGSVAVATPAEVREAVAAARAAQADWARCASPSAAAASRRSARRSPIA